MNLHRRLSRKILFIAALVAATAFVISFCNKYTYSKLPDGNELEKLAKELSDDDKGPKLYYPSHSITYLKDDHNPADAIRYLHLLEQNGRYFDTISTAIQLRDWYEREGIPKGSEMDKKAISNSLESSINRAVGTLNSQRPWNATEEAMDYFEEGDEIWDRRGLGGRETRHYGIACLKKSIELDPAATMEEGINAYSLLKIMLWRSMPSADSTMDPEIRRVERTLYETGLEIAKGMGTGIEKVRNSYNEYRQLEIEMRDYMEPKRMLPFIPIS
jgi:hypothetical protein